MIELENISKVFTLTKDQRKVVGESKLRPKLFKAVDSISFKCNPSSVFALLGPNGSGKTTTLRMISTMISPTSGMIKIKDVDVMKNGREARKSIGFMTNQTALYDRLSPYEMVKYFADLNSMEKVVFEERCKSIFDTLDMNSFANKRIGTLSSGMKQKTSIARTIIHNPDIIVFDEPTTGLDVMTSRSIIELIRNSKDEKKTIIFSSHRMEEVQSLADDIGVIYNGKLIFSGTKLDFESLSDSSSYDDTLINLIDNS
jgi:sodium transport system ATP-binding protein